MIWKNDEKTVVIRISVDSKKMLEEISEYMIKTQTVIADVAIQEFYYMLKEAAGEKDKIQTRICSNARGTHEGRNEL